MSYTCKSARCPCMSNDELNIYNNLKVTGWIYEVTLMNLCGISYSPRNLSLKCTISDLKVGPPINNGTVS